MRKKERLDMIYFVVIVLVLILFINFVTKNPSKSVINKDVTEVELSCSSKNNEVEAINLRIDFLKNLLSSSSEEMLYDSMKGSIVSRKLIEKECNYFERYLQKLINQ